MNSILSARWNWQILLPFTIIWALTGGCSNPPSHPSATSAHAWEVLVTALEAWKEGQAGALSQREPPIRFVDDDLSEGAELTDYEIEEDRPIAAFENVQVHLSLRDRQGNAISKAVSYQVSTNSGLAVLRSDP